MTYVLDGLSFAGPFNSIIPNFSYLHFQNYTKKQITAHIPVGNANLTLMITVCTIAISWTVSICTIIALFNKKDAIKNKLK